MKYRSSSKRNTAAAPRELAPLQLTQARGGDGGEANTVKQKTVDNPGGEG